MVKSQLVAYSLIGTTFYYSTNKHKGKKGENEIYHGYATTNHSND